MTSFLLWNKNDVICIHGYNYSGKWFTYTRTLNASLILSFSCASLLLQSDESWGCEKLGIRLALINTGLAQICPN